MTTILIAEDDPNIRMGLADLLEAHSFTCFEAADGEAAWQLYQSQQPDLVLLDIMMPKMDGFSVCRKIRQQDEHTPILFITAKAEEIDQVLGLELGADDYIKKPFGTREVTARIKAVLRRSQSSKPLGTATNEMASSTEQPSSQAHFYIADLVIKPEQLRACRGEAHIELSTRDLKILTLLHQQQGNVVSREALFDYCWGRDYLPSSRTLDQHISKLRKMIEKDAKSPQIIHTIHGVGYRYDG